MPRIKRIRKISGPPHFRGFTPIGATAQADAIILDFEEYEAICLCDYDFYNHLEASRIMNVSRPTFARIYEQARRKVAEAFVRGAPIIFEGGKVYYDSEWYSCADCGCRFNHLQPAEAVNYCALCGSSLVAPVVTEQHMAENSHSCVCPDCGHQQVLERGTPCKNVYCKHCNTRMRRRVRARGAAW